MVVGREIVLLMVHGKLMGKYVFGVVEQFLGSGINKIWSKSHVLGFIVLCFGWKVCPSLRIFGLTCFGVYGVSFLEMPCSLSSWFKTPVKIVRLRFWLIKGLVHWRLFCTSAWLVFTVSIFLVECYGTITVLWSSLFVCSCMGSETAICPVVQTNLKQGCCGFESAILAGLTVVAGSFFQSHGCYVMIRHTEFKGAYTYFFRFHKRLQNYYIPCETLS